ncbi:MAG: hypothetical protein HY866_18875, partial [Chloroflexi bacterium]|nr:hypothetical protein [Chloroflexota bacterium]
MLSLFPPVPMLTVTSGTLGHDGDQVLDMIPITPGGDLRRTPGTLHCVIIRSMQHLPHEPGLIKVFRLSIGVQWILAALTTCAQIADEKEPTQFMAVFTLLLTSVLFGLLSWEWIGKRLGRLFLPLALWMASAGPIVGITLATAIQIDQGARGDASWASPGGLILWLLV